MLRAIIWKRSGNIREATRIAGFCGQLMSLVLIAFGIYMVLAPTFRAYFMGLWSVLVGVFLLSAATSVVRSTRESATVAQAMSPPIAIEPDLPITRFVDETLPLNRHVTFPVAHDRRLLGILSLEDLKKIAREKWRGLRAREVMRTVDAQLYVPERLAGAQRRRRGWGSERIRRTCGLPAPRALAQKIVNDHRCLTPIFPR